MKCQSLFSGKNKKTITKYDLKGLPSILCINNLNRTESHHAVGQLKAYANGHGRDKPVHS